MIVFLQAPRHHFETHQSLKIFFLQVTRGLVTTRQVPMMARRRRQYTNKVSICMIVVQFYWLLIIILKLLRA